MERWGLSPRVGAPSPGQCHVRQRHLRQRCADGDLADQPADAPCTPRARTARPYSWRAQRQCRAPSLMRSAMMARALSAPFGRRALANMLYRAVQAKLESVVVELTSTNEAHDAFMTLPPYSSPREGMGSSIGGNGPNHGFRAFEL